MRLKAAKISNLKMFCLTILLIDHLSKICLTLFWPMVHRCKKCSDICTFGIYGPLAVFQIEPVLPSETDKKAFGRADNGSSPPCRTGLFSATGEFLNFSNRTIIKGDTATFVKQCQNHVFPLFIWLNCFIFCVTKCGQVASCAGGQL